MEAKKKGIKTTLTPLASTTTLTLGNITTLLPIKIEGSDKNADVFTINYHNESDQKKTFTKNSGLFIAFEKRPLLAGIVSSRKEMSEGNYQTTVLALTAKENTWIDNIIIAYALGGEKSALGAMQHQKVVTGVTTKKTAPTMNSFKTESVKLEFSDLGRYFNSDYTIAVSNNLAPKLKYSYYEWSNLLRDKISLAKNIIAFLPTNTAMQKLEDTVFKALTETELKKNEFGVETIEDTDLEIIKKQFIYDHFYLQILTLPLTEKLELNSEIFTSIPILHWNDFMEGTWTTNFTEGKWKDARSVKITSSTITLLPENELFNIEYEWTDENKVTTGILAPIRFRNGVIYPINTPIISKNLWYLLKAKYPDLKSPFK